jgi:ATP-dependent DNA ligase
MIPFFYPPQPTRIWPTSALMSTLSSDPSWDAEIKYNGWRTLIFKHSNSISIFNRHSTIIDINIDVFLPLFRSIPNETIFDGELLDRRTKDLKNVIVLWDTPFYKGKDLRALSLKLRRQHLDSFQLAPSHFRTETVGQVYRVQQYTTDFLQLYNTVVARNDAVEEGIVLKKWSSLYRSHPSRGIDILDWLKVKKIGDHARV